MLNIFEKSLDLSSIANHFTTQSCCDAVPYKMIRWLGRADAYNALLAKNIAVTS